MSRPLPSFVRAPSQVWRDMRDAGAKTGCAATLDFDSAQRLLASHVEDLGTEDVKLAKAGRRYLAEPVLAGIDGPRCHTAAMDGFAVRAADVASGMRSFRIIGTNFPGAPSDRVIGSGEAAHITTGAAMPTGADQVIMWEDTASGGAWMRITGTPSRKPHVRLRASDFAIGDIMVPAGRMITPRTLVAAAAADVGTVSVWRRPRVAVLATGDEICQPGSAAASPTGLPDSVSEAVILLCHQWGAKPAGDARVKDDQAAITAAASRLLADCDVLVMVGGASRGLRDFAKAGLEPLGLHIVFADVAMKPGKPVWYGRIGGCHVIGLPGNPTAAMTVARLFLVPLLTGLAGRDVQEALDWRPMRLTADLEGFGDRESFLCAEIDRDGVRVIERQSASSQAMLARADVLVRRPPSAAPLSIGDSVCTLKF